MAIPATRSPYLVTLLSLLMILAGCGEHTAPAPAQRSILLATTTTTQPAASYTTAVQQLYIAYFGRPADPGGLANFTAALSALGAPTDLPGLDAAYGSNAAVRALIDQFGTSDESKALYTGDAESFVRAIYNNVLGRAPDAGGLAFWAGELKSGSLSQGKAAISIMAGALTNTTAAGLADAQTVANKSAVGANFTSSLATQAQINAYSGNAAAAVARTLLASVINVTNVSAYQSNVTSAINTLVTATTSTYKISFAVTGGSIYNFEGTTDITTSGANLKGNDTLEVLLVPDMQHAGSGNELFASGNCTPVYVSNNVHRITASGDCTVTVRYYLIDSDHDGRPDATDSALHLQWVNVQPHVIRDAQLSARSTPLTATAYVTGNLGRRADGSPAQVAKVKMRTNFSGVGTTISSGVEEIELFDDGTHGDGAAGDGIWTATFTPSGVVTGTNMVWDKSAATLTYGGNAREVNHDLVFYDASGALLTPVNTGNVVGQGSLVMVLKDSVPQATVTKVADNMYKSGRFLVLVDPRYAQHDDSRWAGRMAARYAAGSFDLFTKWNFGRSFGANWSWFHHARRWASGIGQETAVGDPTSATDESSGYGLPGICGVIDMGNIHVAAHGFNHEVNHCWSAYYDQAALKLTEGVGHWISTSVVMGPVQVSPNLIQVGNDWKTQWQDTAPSNRVMSMLDLYNAGLANISEVPSMYYVDESNWSAAAHFGEVVPPSLVHQMTAADLVRLYGTRSPSYDGQVKNWRMLSLVINSVPLTEAEAAYMDMLLTHISGNSDGDPTGNTYSPSFAKVCRGRCTLSTEFALPSAQALQARFKPTPPAAPAARASRPVL